MRGVFRDQGGLFSYVSPESRVPADHPLRRIRELVRDVLLELNRKFTRLYARDGRPSVPPEQLLSALLIQALYVARLRAAGITPHVTQNHGLTKTGRQRRSAIDGRTTRHGGYSASQSRRPMIACIFGWGKQHGTMRKTRHRGIRRVAGDFLLNLIAYNLVRIPKLQAG